MRRSKFCLIPPGKEIGNAHWGFSIFYVDSFLFFKTQLVGTGNHVIIYRCY